MTDVIERSRSDGETYLPPSDKDGLASMHAIFASLKVRSAKLNGPRLVDASGNETALPDALVPVLLQVAEAMQAGLAVTVAPHHLMLSTQEAADLLQISRTTLVRLLESGVIPFDKPNKHRKVRLDDLLEYRRRQRRQADDALSDMVADSQRLGLYDGDQEAIDGALKRARARRAGEPR